MYVASEILLNNLPKTGISISDLLLVDIWALGIMIFCLINSSLKYPFRSEIRSAGGISCQEELRKFICSLLIQKKHPLQDPKYEVQRATVWSGLEEVYNGCVNFNRNCGMSLEEAADIKESSLDLSEYVDVVHLKVSQGTAIEQLDQQLAFRLKDTAEHEEHEGSVQVESALINDGTNPCAFIFVKIADILLRRCGTGNRFFTNLVQVAEETIWNLPAQINEHRQLDKLCDVLEAYAILKEQMMVGACEFSEELPFADHVFSFEGRRMLHSKLCELGRKDFFAIFTSDPFVLSIGCYDEHPFIMDTHPVTLEPGKGNGLLLIGRQNSRELWKTLCVWL